VLGNTQEEQSYGKCHRNIPPAPCQVKGGEGKASSHRASAKQGKSKGEMVRQELTSSQVTGWLGKPYLEQDRIKGRLRCSAEVLGLVA